MNIIYLLAGLFIGVILTILTLRLASAGVLNMVADRDKEKPAIFLGLSKSLKYIYKKRFIILSVKRISANQLRNDDTHK